MKDKLIDFPLTMSTTTGGGPCWSQNPRIPSDIYLWMAGTKIIESSWIDWVEFQAAGFNLAPPWPLQLFGEWTSKWRISVSQALHILTFQIKKKKKAAFLYETSLPQGGAALHNWVPSGILPRNSVFCSNCYCTGFWYSEWNESIVVIIGDVQGTFILRK